MGPHASVNFCFVQWNTGKGGPHDAGDIHSNFRPLKPGVFKFLIKDDVPILKIVSAYCFESARGRQPTTWIAHYVFFGTCLNQTGDMSLFNLCPLYSLNNFLLNKAMGSDMRACGEMEPKVPTVYALPHACDALRQQFCEFHSSHERHPDDAIVLIYLEHLVVLYRTVVSQLQSRRLCELNLHTVLMGLPHTVHPNVKH